MKHFAEAVALASLVALLKALVDLDLAVLTDWHTAALAIGTVAIRAGARAGLVVLLA